MTSSNTHDLAGAGSSDDLKGLEILLVEDFLECRKIIGKATDEIIDKGRKIASMTPRSSRTCARPRRAYWPH